MSRDATITQLILLLRDLRPEERRQLEELRQREGWTPTELTQLVQGWFGVLGRYVEATVARTANGDEALTVSFSPPEAQGASAEREYKRGVNLAQRGQVQEALAHFEHAAHLWPAADYLIALGHAYLEMHQLEDAESTFLTCLRIAPRHCDALTMLGNVY